MSLTARALAKLSPEHVCDWCTGAGFEPTEENGLIPCLACGGCGYATAHGDLGPSRSEKKRPYSYAPGIRRLTLGTRAPRREPQTYTVTEFTPDAGFPGRAFLLTKADGEVYSCLIGREGMICDCAGQSYAAAAKANQRAHEGGRELFHTLGCKHLDAMYRLLTDGWLDLTAADMPTPEPTIDPFTTVA